MIPMEGKGLVIKILAALVILYAAIGSAKEVNKRTYTILEGDNLLVICNISERNDTNVYWTKNDSKSTFHQAGKRLEILNIKRSSSGDYICHALNTSYPVPDYNETDANKTVQVINVNVEYPGEVVYFSVGPYTLMENRTFTVTCNFQGHPDPKWLIRNRDTGKMLITANLPAEATIGPIVATCGEDTGFWECTGHNRLNHGVNATGGHNITVNCPPRPQIFQNTYAVKAEIGKPATLIMNLVANPRANCIWSKDDGTDISIFTQQEDYSNKTMLIFKMVTVHVFGNYTLKMQNQFGYYYAHYQLIATGPPETPTNLWFSDVTYNSVTLRWTSGFDMGSRQHFIVMKLYDGNTFESISNWIIDNSSTHGINQHWTYVQTGLSSNTIYNLTVVSENARNFMSGFARPSVVFLTQEYPYDLPQSSNVNVLLVVGLVCGTLGCVAILAFVVYIIKYRRIRTSYLTINEKPRKNYEAELR